MPIGLIFRRLSPVVFLLWALLPPYALSQSGKGQVYLAFFGDSGTGDRPQKLVSIQLNRVADQDKLDYVFLLGDNIYPKGEAKHIKRKYLDVYQKLFAKGVRFHAALGNHDVEKCGVAEDEPLPRDARVYTDCDVSKQLGEARFGYLDGKRYYSVLPEGETPLFEVFAVDTNTLAIREHLGRGAPQDTAQLEWLDQALAGSKAVWKIVVMHNAMHTPRPATFLEVKGHRPEYALREQLEPIFQKHNVDVVFQAHNHFYSRLAPQGGVRYFVTGGGGNRTYRFKQERGYTVDIEGRGKFHHFTHVRLTGESFEFCAIDSQGAVRDAGSFRKGNSEDRSYSSGCPF